MNEMLKINKISYLLKVKEGKNKKDKEILKDVSFSVYGNEILGLCGESGGGKSTLAKIIAGLLKPTGGYLQWDKSFKEYNTKSSPVQILFQNHGDTLNPFRKVVHLVDEALKIQGVQGISLISEREKICDSVGLTGNLIYRKGFELSGGEQQRAALARLLAANPKLLLLDEPFSAQDVESQLNMIRLLKNINKKFRVTIICISHDLRILRTLVERVIIIKEGQIVDEGNAKEIFSKPSRPYTKFLLNAENYRLSYEELHNNL